MCGIAGIISEDPSQVSEFTLKKMAACVAHRGPDDESTWISDKANAGFGHRRLSVIDTSDNAAQPMHYLDRYTIVYNGEIYNYRELREQLQPEFKFKTLSDTEVILACYAKYGKGCLDLFDGMFAFALWDEKEQQLFCARDRFGEKPFYYSFNQTKRQFYFGSEIKTLFTAGLGREINNEMLLAFLTLGQTSDPHDLSKTFFTNILRLPPSHYLLLNLRKFQLSVCRYWNLSTGITDTTLKRATEQVQELISVSVKRRLRSDVAIGLNLSGGVDSSAIAATIYNSGMRQLHAFTAVFPGFHRDEDGMSALVSERFSFVRNRVSPNATGFAADFDDLIAHQEEPFTSASVYAQYAVCRAAAENNVTVLLDGQGADEVFAGYEKYLHWKRYGWLPQTTSKLLMLKQRMQVDYNQDMAINYLKRHADQVGIYKPAVRSLNDLLYYNVFVNGLEELLRYSDRNAMAFGREIRLPFLYHELVNYVFSLPDKLKIGNGYTKLLLRETMRGQLPDAVILNRRKIGFEPPQRAWMQHPDMIGRAQLARRVLVEQGILKKNVLRQDPVPHEAYTKNSKEWKWMMAGNWLFNINKKGV